MTKSYHALVVDDEKDILQLTKMTLSRIGIACTSACDIKTAKQLLEKNSFDFCLTDMRLPDGSGLELVELLKQQNKPCPIAVITAYGSIQAAVRCLKAGAFDFVTKPIDIQCLRHLAFQALQQHSPATRPSQAGPQAFFTGTSKATQHLKQRLEQLANSQTPAVLKGEPGAGAGLAARHIHQHSSRKDSAFIRVDCSTLAPQDLHTHFFGADGDPESLDEHSLLAQAQGGTLFLQKIDALPLAFQDTLHQLIQNRRVKHRPGAAPIYLDVRFLCSTYKNLAALVDKGLFRQDLYYRLNIIELTIPALRERKDDLQALCQLKLSQLAKLQNLDDTPQLHHQALRKLMEHDFPGNVRELENILQRAIVLSSKKIIYADAITFKTTTQHSREVKPNLSESSSLESQIALVEKQHILKALQHHQYNKTRTAKALGLSLRALRYRIKKLQIE